MNEMNPQSWPLEETEQMWIDQLDATLEEATAHLTGDFAGEVAAYVNSQRSIDFPKTGVRA